MNRKEKELAKFNIKTAAIIRSINRAVESGKEKKAVDVYQFRLWNHIIKAELRNYELSDSSKEFFTVFKKDYYEYLMKKAQVLGKAPRLGLMVKFINDVDRRTCFVINQNMVLLGMSKNWWNGIGVFLKAVKDMCLYRMNIIRYTEGYETTSIRFVKGATRLGKITGMTRNEIMEAVTKSKKRYVRFVKEEKPVEAVSARLSSSVSYDSDVDIETFVKALVALFDYFGITGKGSVGGIKFDNSNKTV